MLLKTKTLQAGVRAVFRIFPKQATRYTVKNVLWWLKELGVDNDTIMVPALCGATPDIINHVTYMANLKQIWEFSNTLIMGCLAQDVMAQWVGGPPNDIRRHKGSFLQLLMDRIMVDINAHGTSNFIQINRRFKEEHPKFKQPSKQSATTTPTGAHYLDKESSLIRIGFHGDCAEWSGIPYGQC